MPVFVNKPEFALKRAEEFLDVGKRVRALEALTEAIKNRKHRIWQKSHEDIMRKFIQLCVELKQSQTAKEGLHQYKNLTANVNPKSLEDIIRYYLKLSESQCDQAREKANVQTITPIVDVDDLDLAESPEGMLLKVVSTDTSQDRADRVVLLPWVRFNWEAYRHCLDLLRNLSKLESLYHDIASQAFKFCLKYVRKTELRKLCEMLRNHIGQISKREVVTPNAVNLNNPETQELNLRTRLVQLDHAIAMEMWQEAFKAIDDIHGLMTILKKVPKAALKANYFEKLALVFLRAGNVVFHAAAQQQLYNLYRNFRKDLQTDELRRLAVTVLLATLAVPLQPPRTHLETLIEYDEQASEKRNQLTRLVGFSQPPTRQRLVEDLQKLGILQHVKPELQQLYQALEASFDPLSMGRIIAEVLGQVNSSDELAYVRDYAKAIEEVAVGKQLRQLAQAYDSIEIPRVIQLMPYTNWQTIERVAIETARNTDLEVRIDHRSPGLFVFGSEMALAPYDTESGNVDDAQMPTDRVRSQLVVLLSSLTRTHRTVKTDQDREEETVYRANLFNLYRKNAQRDHQANLGRAAKSDQRQKDIEKRELERSRKAEMAKKTQEKEIVHAERLRQERHTTESELQRKAQKEKEIERNIVREKIDKMKQTEYGLRVLKELGDRNLEEITVRELDDLEKRHREEIRREEEENANRLKQQEKKIDHIVRAKHLEEIVLRKEDNVHLIEAFRQLWLKDENRRIAEARAKREEAVRKRERMRLIVKEREELWSAVQQRKEDLYRSKLAEWQQKYESQRAARLAKRREERQDKRRNEYQETQVKLKKQQEEEETARKAEEAEAIKLKENRIKEEKLAETERKKRERELEIERKYLMEQNQAPAAGKYVPRMVAAADGAYGDQQTERRFDGLRASGNASGPASGLGPGGAEKTRPYQPPRGGNAPDNGAPMTRSEDWTRRGSGADPGAGAGGEAAAPPSNPPPPSSNVYRPPMRDDRAGAGVGAARGEEDAQARPWMRGAANVDDRDRGMGGRDLNRDRDVNRRDDFSQQQRRPFDRDRERQPPRTETAVPQNWRRN